MNLVNSQGKAIGCGQIYYGVNAVDIQEEGNKEYEYALLVGNVVLEYREQPLERVAYGLGLALDIVHLLEALCEGKGEAQPPYGVEYEYYDVCNCRV